MPSNTPLWNCAPAIGNSLAEQDKEKTAFICKHGLFDFNIIPYGVTNTPAYCQQEMEKKYRELIGKFCFVYIDDITVYSSFIEEHYLHLLQVFGVLSSRNFAFRVHRTLLLIVWRGTKSMSLAYPDASLAYRLYTDSSNTVISAILA